MRYFGGYQSYRKTQSVTRASGFARFAPRPLRAALSGALAGGAGAIASPDAARKAFAAFLDPDAASASVFIYTSAFHTTDHRDSIRTRYSAVGRSFLGGSGSRKLQSQSRLMDDFSGVCWIESRSYLANTLLRDTDAMSMRHSLEVRVPFLDLPLFECILALPESQKRGSTRPKELLISALGDLLPEEVVTQKKRTFTFPWENWLRGALGKRVAVGLGDWPEILESQIPRKFALSTWNDFIAGRTSWSRPWSLYVLAEWVKRNLSGGPESGPDRKKVATVSIV